MDEWLQGNGDMKRKQKTTGYEEINERLWEWFVSNRSKHLPISGPILQTQALLLAKTLNKPDFKASNGWLDSFKNRHKIVWSQVCGEANDVNKLVVQEWETKLSNILTGYDKKDIFNCDETGLFFRTLPNKTLALKGEKCVGGKMSKERLTVLLCANLAGDLIKPLVIGKSARPRCFSRIDVNKLPVTWRSNKKAWMTSSIMEEWLNSFNSKMQLQNRRVLLFLDNATCHPHINLSNVTLIWFPANTTSITQPLDQGVIYMMKIHYRRMVLQSIISKMNDVESANELAKSISVLDAIYWIDMAVKKIKPETIKKCFKKAKFFSSPDTTTNVLNDANEQMIILKDLCSNVFENCDPGTYVNFDEDLATSITVNSATEVALSIAENINDYSQSPSDEDEEGISAPCQSISSTENTIKINSYFDAIQSLSDLQQFGARKNCTEFLEYLCKARDSLERQAVKEKTKQTTLTEMWKSHA